ncbi:hypothetical protein AMAG_19847 [Allomyces macrogynus ATCC 38327]|uniref:Uncharacterized protein n=1 Tax=Allomyces macrogynus (strain ATCC 38327) TaxID=578462 RepID=A0A0L0T053_ALLM3|nr:hypothetical protein AMAG_19847 [Allomyces macrogynus ATCC 38327]|eukprot:KNE68132.1 hypothetical protein AMAG_19847 [Allomyces macrogynus ATCC 38327]
MFGMADEGQSHGKFLFETLQPGLHDFAQGIATLDLTCFVSVRTTDPAAVTVKLLWSVSWRSVRQARARKRARPCGQDGVSAAGQPARPH